MVVHRAARHGADRNRGVVAASCGGHPARGGRHARAWAIPDRTTAPGSTRALTVPVCAQRCGFRCSTTLPIQSWLCGWARRRRLAGTGCSSGITCAGARRSGRWPTRGSPWQRSPPPPSGSGSAYGHAAGPPPGPASRCTITGRTHRGRHPVSSQARAVARRASVGGRVGGQRQAAAPGCPLPGVLPVQPRSRESARRGRRGHRRVAPDRSADGMRRRCARSPREDAPERSCRSCRPGCDCRTAQRRSWMRIRLPAGSRKAQSRTPYGCSVGSWTTSASLARSRSKVPSRSLVARRIQP